MNTPTDADRHIDEAINVQVANMQKAHGEWIRTIVAVSAFVLPLMVTLPREEIRMSAAFVLLKGSWLGFGLTVVFGSIVMLNEIMARKTAANLLYAGRKSLGAAQFLQQTRTTKRVEPKHIFWLSEKLVLVTWFTAILSILMFAILYW